MTNFNIDKTYMLGANEGSSQRTANNLIVLHETTNVGAKNNASYFKKYWNSSYTYTQYVIGDGGKIYQVGEDGYVAWGAGDYANTNAPVQIELARTYNKATFEKDYAAFVNFARAKANQYGIPVELDTSNPRGIKTHYWISNNVWGSHEDPVQSYLEPIWGITQEQLAHDIATGIGETIVEPAPQTPNRDQITIKHGPITGIAGWNLKGEIIPGSNTKLVNASSWKTASLKKINGLPMYQIATDEFVPKKYTDQAGVVTINAIAGVNTVNFKGIKLGHVLHDLSQWKTEDKFYTINGNNYFKVATDEYVESYYTLGGGNK